MNNEVDRVLSWYPIHPLRTEGKGKVVQVEAKEGYFALRATVLKEEQAERFFQTLRFFEKQQVPTVLPLVRTVTGNWYCFENGRIYYLEPWVENCRGLRKENDFFKTLAIFHRYTERKVTIAENSLREQSEHYKTERDQEMLRLESYADEVEKKKYYSPFDLSFLMHFPFIYRLHKDSLHWYRKWEDEAAAAEKMKVVRCHGNPTPDHLVYDPRGGYRWTQLEHAGDGHPQHDIACLYRACLEENVWEPLQTYSWVSSYKEHAATFDEMEEALLKSELLNEATFYPFIEESQYRKAETEHIWTYRLEKQILFHEKIQETVNAWPLPQENKE